MRLRRNVAAPLTAAIALGLMAPASHAVVPRDARGFVDAIGVNTHLFYTDTPYGDYATLKQRLQELGVRHIRDGMDPDHRQFFFDRVNDLARSGIKSTMIACDFPNRTDWREYASDLKNKVRGSVEAVEGVNEPNNTSHGGGEWWRGARGCNFYLHEFLRGEQNGPPLGLPVYGPSATGTSYEKVGNLWTPRHADGGVMHPYPGGHNKPSGPSYHPFAKMMQDIRNANFEGRQVAVIATETGYHDALNQTTDHPPVSQRADAIYMPRLFLEYAKAGVQRTHTYELVDQRPDPGLTDREANFGLFEHDWSYKPVAHALKNTIGFLDSPSKGPQTPLDYRLESTEDDDGTGPAGPVRDLLMQKADGSWWLALWQDSLAWDAAAKKDISNPANVVTVYLPRTMGVVGYRPTQGTGSVGSVTPSAFYAGVGDDVLLIKMTG